MAEQAELDGIGMEAAYGVAFLSGLKNMERPPDPKASEGYDWPEMQGNDYLLNDKFDDYDVSLDLVIQGSDIADAISKKDAMMASLSPATFHTLFVFVTGKTYNIKYNKTTGFDFLQTSTGYGIKMTLDITVLVGVEQNEQLIILDGNNGGV